jgi:hypothetical protein
MHFGFEYRTCLQRTLHPARTTRTTSSCGAWVTPCPPTRRALTTQSAPGWAYLTWPEGGGRRRLWILLLEGRWCTSCLGDVSYADLLVDRGFVPMLTPLLARERTFFGTGYLPFFANQLYRIADSDLALIGTSEQTLIAFYGDM